MLARHQCNSLRSKTRRSTPSHAVNQGWRCAVPLSLLGLLGGLVMPVAADDVSPPAASAPRREYVVMRNVTYGQKGDVKLLADVYVPQGDRLRPGVLLVHGGAWMSGTKRTMTYAAQRLAESGYTAVAIDYRLAPKHKFPAQFEDCRTALAWMHSEAKQYQIDSEKIAGFGYSAGAHLVSLLGTFPEYGLPEDANRDQVQRWRLQAVVAGGTPSDFVWLPENNASLTYFLGGTRKEKPAIYRLASPLRHVTADDPPMLFYHGESDLLVPKVNGTWIYDKARAVGIKTELLLLPKTGHLGAFLNRDMTEKSIKFLDQVFQLGKTNDQAATND